jgi:hypothetical protein
MKHLRRYLRLSAIAAIFWALVTPYFWPDPGHFLTDAWRSISYGGLATCFLLAAAQGWHRRFSSQWFDFCALTAGSFAVSSLDGHATPAAFFRSMIPLSISLLTPTHRQPKWLAPAFASWSIVAQALFQFGIRSYVEWATVVIINIAFWYWVKWRLGRFTSLTLLSQCCFILPGIILAAWIYSTGFMLILAVMFSCILALCAYAFSLVETIPLP